MVHRFLLSDLVPRVADSRPDAVAASFEDATLTWAELDDRVARLAAALRDVGVENGDRVGIYLHKSMESLVTVHGILRAGAAYVPIDPMAPVDVMATIIGDCGIEVLVSHELRRAGVSRLARQVNVNAVLGLAPQANDLPEDDLPETDLPQTERDRTRFLSWDDIAGYQPIDPVPVLGDDLAYVMYTSGSTGPPKGIMHTHRSGLAYASMSSTLYGLGPEDRVANFSPLHFDMSTFEILAGVAAGSRVVLIPEPHLRLPASLAAYIADQGCTTLYTVPSLFQQLLARGGLADHDLSAVRWVLPAGEVFPPEPLAKLMALFPTARFSNVYGPAEVNQCTYFHFDAPPSEGRTLPIGYRCPDAELLVVDERDRPVADGEQGELLVRTATMMAGYWNRPDLDRACFVERTGPGGHSGRWYRTGDLVSRQPGGSGDDADAEPALHYHGRRDNQVKIRGNRVELEMVEAAVGSLAGIEQAVVGVRVDDGGDSRLVVRYIATAGPADGEDQKPDRDRNATEERDRDQVRDRAWRRALAAALPPYAVPDRYEAVERFPLTPSGKIDRRTVRAQIAVKI